jgi:hypothetical protein
MTWQPNQMFMENNFLSKNQILYLVVALVATTFYFWFNPVKFSFYPACMFYQVTGYHCPGCGGQRAFHALLHGHFAEAFKLNLLIYLVLPLAAVKFAELFFNKTILHPFFQSRVFLVGVGIFIIVFGLVRNLPLAVCEQIRP